MTSQVSALLVCFAWYDCWFYTLNIAWTWKSLSSPSAPQLWLPRGQMWLLSRPTTSSQFVAGAHQLGSAWFCFLDTHFMQLDQTIFGAEEGGYLTYFSSGAVQFLGYRFSPIFSKTEYQKRPFFLEPVVRWTCSESRPSCQMGGGGRSY